MALVAIFGGLFGLAFVGIALGMSSRRAPPDQPMEEDPSGEAEPVGADQLQAVARELFEAIGRGDSERLSRLCHPAVVFRPPCSDERYFGLDQVLGWLAQLQGSGTNVDMVPSRFVCNGRKIAVVGRVRIAQPGALRDEGEVWVLSFKDGRVRKFESLRGH